MYIPAPYVETRKSVLIDAVRQRSFGTLITVGGAGIEISHLPFVTLARDDDSIDLIGHLARSNGQWNDVNRSFEAVASFVVDSAYISPSWYPSKILTGKMVPTWNYIAIEARGPLEVIEEANELLAILHSLTDRHESGRDNPWSIADAPEDFTAAMLRGIVGIRLRVREFVGAWKLDQKKSESDRQGAIAGLSATPSTKAMAQAMAIVSSQQSR